MQYTDNSCLFAVMSTAEFRERKEEFAYQKEMLHSLGSIRYCKAELFKYKMSRPNVQKILY